uniref:Uncharacterized protein n=1 Tax=Echinococcus canadensis TaxID=519352 RepID=A0A915EXE0_9CEST
MLILGLSKFSLQKGRLSIPLLWLNFGFSGNYQLPIMGKSAENGPLYMQPFEALIGSLFFENGQNSVVIVMHLIKRASIWAHFSTVALSLTCEEASSIPHSTAIETIINNAFFPRALLLP